MSNMQTSRPFDATNMDYGYPERHRQVESNDPNVSPEFYALHKELKKIRKLLENMVATHHEERQQDKEQEFNERLLRLQPRGRVDMSEGWSCSHQDPWQIQNDSVRDSLDRLICTLTGEAAQKKIKKYMKRWR